jgi:hypothetical protein
MLVEEDDTSDVRMAAAALTPRVRIMAVCDRVRESKTEADVFDLKGVRRAIRANTFPVVPSHLWLYLLLSNPREGEYPGYVLVVHEKTDKTVFFGQLAPRPQFDAETEFFPLVVRIRCSFPEAGRYTFQVWFYQQQGSDILKGEMPFDVLQEGA